MDRTTLCTSNDVHTVPAECVAAFDEFVVSVSNEANKLKASLTGAVQHLLAEKHALSSLLSCVEERSGQSIANSGRFCQNVASVTSEEQSKSIAASGRISQNFASMSSIESDAIINLDVDYQVWSSANSADSTTILEAPRHAKETFLLNGPKECQPGARDSLPKVSELVTEALRETGEMLRELRRAKHKRAVFRWDNLVDKVLLWNIRMPEYRTSGVMSVQSDVVAGRELLLRPGWIVGDVEEKLSTLATPRSPSSPSMMKRSSTMIATESIGKVRMGDVFMDNSLCLRTFVGHPDKPVSVLHSFVATAMVLYDIVLFPLIYAFSLNVSEGPIRIMMWVTTVFWTIDIPYSFLQGYYVGGVIEMRVANVTLHYLKTWFAFDFCIVSIDWVTYIAEYNSQQDSDLSTVLDLGRTIRVSRFLRAMRVLRFMRLYRELQSLITKGGFKASEYTRVISRLFTLLALMLLINHYISCAWVGLAIEHKGRTWMTDMSLADAAPAYQYISALHWSLTQFTPATNNIMAANARERSFATVAVLFGLVMFSTFISSLTNAVMEIKKIREARFLEESQIREFLQRRRVPLDTCMLIWHYYKNHYRRQRKFTHESDISFFEQMPTSLRQALHANIYIPVLSEHPFFRLAAGLNDRVAFAMCACVSERCLQRHREVFADGEIATQMLILESGQLKYECKEYEKTQHVMAPNCISEAVLWSNWIHCGQLIAESHCEVLEISAHQFESRMLQLGNCHGILDNIRIYAAMFMQTVRDSEEADEADPTGSVLTMDGPPRYMDTLPVTDLMMDEIQLESLAHKAFGMCHEESVEPTYFKPRLSLRSADGVFAMLRSFTPVGRVLGKDPKDQPTKRKFQSGVSSNRSGSHWSSSAPDTSWNVQATVETPISQ